MIREEIGKECVENDRLRYWFTMQDPRRKRLTGRYFVEKYEGFSNKTAPGILARWHVEMIEKRNGGKIRYPDGMTMFPHWIESEYNKFGPLFCHTLLEDHPTALLAHPDEVWAIYRVQMMAKSGKMELDLPFFEPYSYIHTLFPENTIAGNP